MRTEEPKWAPYLHTERPVPPRPQHGIDTTSLTELLRKEGLLVPCAGNMHLGVPKFPYILGNQGEVHIMTVADHPQIPNQPAPFFCDLPPQDQMVIAALVQKHILNRQFTSAIASTNEAAHGVMPFSPRTAFQQHFHLVGYPNRLQFGTQTGTLKLRESLSQSNITHLHLSVQSAFDRVLDFGLNPYNCLIADITDHVQNAAQLARLITRFEIALATGWRLTRKETIFIISPDDEAVDMHETPAFSVGILRGVHDDPEKVYMYGAPRFYTKYGGLESQGLGVSRVESSAHTGPEPAYLAAQMQYARELAGAVAPTLQSYGSARMGQQNQKIRLRTGVHNPAFTSPSPARGR